MTQTIYQSREILRSQSSWTPPHSNISRLYMLTIYPLIATMFQALCKHGLPRATLFASSMLTVLVPACADSQQSTADNDKGSSTAEESTDNTSATTSSTVQTTTASDSQTTTTIDTSNPGSDSTITTSDSDDSDSTSTTENTSDSESTSTTDTTASTSSTDDTSDSSDSSTTSDTTGSDTCTFACGDLCCADGEVCEIDGDMHTCTTVDPPFCLPGEAIHIVLSGDFSGEVTEFNTPCFSQVLFGTNPENDKPTFDLPLFLEIPGATGTSIVRAMADGVEVLDTPSNVPTTLIFLGQDELHVQDLEHCTLSLSTNEIEPADEEIYRVVGEINCSKPLETAFDPKKTFTLEKFTFTVAGRKSSDTSAATWR